MKKVLVIGGLSYNLMLYVDQFPQPEPQTVFSKGFHETVGSTGAGKALNLHRLEVKTTFHELIGEDVQGYAIRSYFEQEGLSFVYDNDSQGTKRHVNLMNAEGSRISIFASYGTFEPEINLSAMEKLIAESEFVVLNIINYCRHLIPVIKRHQKPVWCDIHDYDGQNSYHQDFINAADFLFMSSEAMPKYRSFMEDMIADGKQLVVCTRGKDGAIALVPDNQWLEISALPYPVVDTNGAGDSFFAGVLYGYLQQYPIETCMRLGTITAGLCIASRELAHPDLSKGLLHREYQRHYGQMLG
jgi:acarbose 7IV-phosphotransferase